VGDLCLELRVTPQDGRAIDATAMEQTHAVVAARVGMAGIAHPSVGRDGDHLVVVLPGLEDGTEVLDGEASQLAAVLRSGPLPLPLEAVSAGPCG
jgi:preprotein translocase subunit SecD